MRKQATFVQASIVLEMLEYTKDINKMVLNVLI